MLFNEAMTWQVGSTDERRARRPTFARAMLPPLPLSTELPPTQKLIQEVKQLPGGSGIHLMSVGWEAILPRLLREVDLLARPGRSDPSQ